jgi:uncharacterized protein (TIGR02099 family)
MVSPSSPGSEAAVPRHAPWYRTAARVATAAALLLWSVFLAGWLTLYWVILPHIDEWRPRVEKLASQAIGLKLTIGSIQVRSGGWVPAFELRDLRLHDRDGREALVLERVHTALSARSLFGLTLRFEQVLIEGARLEVRRDGAGRWHVAGLDWEGSVGSGDTRARDWLLAQHEFVVLNAELHWTDERSGAPPLALTQLDLVLRNGLRQHALRLDATPPPGWGKRFSLRGRFSQPLLAPAGELRRWSGTLFAEFPQADIAELRRHLVLPVELGEGDGALRAWVDIDDGVPRKATLDFALRAVSLQLAASLQPLHMQQLQGRLDVDRDNAGIRLHAHDLAFLTGEGLAWPAGDLSVAWRQAQDLRETWTASTPVTGGEVAGDRLNLDTLARIAESAPLGEPLRALLASLAPSGTLDSLKARWAGPLDQPVSYQLDARFSNLTLQAAPAASGSSPGRPGLRQAGLQLSANERGGQARLSIENGALVFPGLWEQPEVPLDTLQAALGWRIQATPGQPSVLEFKLADARIANADLQAEVDATWHSGAGAGQGRGGRFPGTLDLNARLQRARAESVARYLPLGLSAAVREHVRDGVQGGSITAATFKVKGDLANFPFHSAREGQLRITLQVRDLVYAYLPSRPAREGQAAYASPWPVVEQASGEIEFDRLAMNLRRLQGRLWGYELRDVQGGIADLAAPQKWLTLQGQGRGPAADLLRFARLAPLGQRTAAALESISVTGASELKVDASIALGGGASTQLRGSLQLAGNDLRLHPDMPPLLGARGSIEFSPQGLAVRPLSARLLGGDTSLEGSIGSDGALRFSAQGTVTAEALRSTPQPAALARVGALMRGQAAWRGTLAVAEGRSDFTLQSNLVGMQIDLPAPLAKPVAASALPLRLQLSPLPETHSLPRDQLQFELGELLKAQFQRELSGPEPRVQRGSIAVQDALQPLPAAGVHAVLKLDRVDLDAWQALAERSGVAAQPGAGGYLPQTIQLRADELRSGSRFLSRVQATLASQGAAAEPGWKASLKADQLAGDIDYRPPRDSAQAGRVMARLQRLSVPQSEVSTVEDLLSQPPASVPALDIVVDDFELRGRKLGRLQVLAVNRLLPGRAGQREWQLDKLDLDVPEAQLRASGRWAGGGSRRMALDFKLALADSGAFVERLGAGKALRGGKGELQGQLSWAGSPLTLDYPSLEGKLRLDIDAGQFLHADPGSARLLGVLSLQSLPRRLSLDFRDLFQEGFAFDSIEGGVAIARGVAETTDMHMSGAQATVLMQGSADLRRETQDLRVLVVPKIDATGAALATMAINPALGLGTLFAQWALREPLIAAGTSELHITGSWADPQVQRIDRNHGAPDPARGATEPAQERPPG